MTDGIDRCRIGFLPNAFVHQARVWDGVLCQVVQVVEKDDQSKFCRAKWYKNKGYATVVVILMGFGQQIGGGHLPNKCLQYWYYYG